MSSLDTARQSTLSAKDFASPGPAKWCPGCGDHAVWAQVRRVLAETGARPENTVFVSGIGCSSRFPYYMNTYGFHTLHGRAPTVATGVKLANPDLNVWIVTGDGDALSIGGNHLLHIIRRNLDVNILLLNNRIYGLTKGQYSPTSAFGQRTKSSPFGTLEQPVRPLSVAIGAGVSFAARAVDFDVKHLHDVLLRASAHRGTSLVEIYQACPTFNAGSFESVADREKRAEGLLYLEHGRPLIFGAGRDKGIRLGNMAPEVVRRDRVDDDDLLIHDEAAARPALAFMLSQMARGEATNGDALPEPVGVLRCVDRPTLDGELHGRIAARIEREGPGDLADLLAGPDNWNVESR